MPGQIPEFLYSDLDLLASDIDGTLLVKGERVPDSVKVELLEAQKVGKNICLASGRGTGSIIQVANDIGLLAQSKLFSIVSVNGGMAHIYDPEKSDKDKSIIGNIIPFFSTRQKHLAPHFPKQMAIPCFSEGGRQILHYLQSSSSYILDKISLPVLQKCIRISEFITRPVGYQITLDMLSHVISPTHNPLPFGISREDNISMQLFQQGIKVYISHLLGTHAEYISKEVELAFTKNGNASKLCEEAVSKIDPKFDQSIMAVALPPIPCFLVYRPPVSGDMCFVPMDEFCCDLCKKLGIVCAITEDASILERILPIANPQKLTFALPRRPLEPSMHLPKCLTECYMRSHTTELPCSIDNCLKLTTELMREEMAARRRMMGGDREEDEFDDLESSYPMECEAVLSLCRAEFKSMFCVCPVPYACEVLPSGMDKEKGLAKICEVFKTEFGRDPVTCTFGDGYNDVNFVKAGTVGIAMDNGSEKVKEVADIILDKSAHEAGVGMFLKDWRERDEKIE
ncbi:hypothetical protein ADUPG1_011539 [Aduncisulcus paluster]|uniref:Uncharacterized protein n=1 Tax=Aduncisulcus paluster TaxID=2918883 RepID=A0ABQ5JW35_9EUKA|nr:hypothetical protein ADUPG1_011539 [Aduncisulcus paluster]